MKVDRTRQVSLGAVDAADRAIGSADQSVYLARMRALARANEIRAARSRLKRRVADGEVSAAEVLLARTPELDGLTLVDLLRSQPRWGAVRTRKFTRRNAVNERKPIGQLTARQRMLLAAQLTQSRHASTGQVARRPGRQPAAVPDRVDGSVGAPASSPSLRPQVIGPAQSIARACKSGGARDAVAGCGATSATVADPAPPL